MKNIFVLPTDKPSRLLKNIQYNTFWLSTEFLHREVKRGVEELEYQNIYITSDEEIKEGDWVYNFEYDYIVQYYSKKHDDKFWYKKIILTTDPDLIKDGAQSIDDEFLEWFVKNPSCEWVETIHGLFNPMGRQVDPMNLGQNHSECVWKYKIIIPKEEPKLIHQQIIDIVGGEDRFRVIAKIKPKQETLEDFIKRESTSVNESIGIIKGANWQAERMYSEEEVHKILGSYSAHKEVFSYKYTYDMWFEQFKKK